MMNKTRRHSFPDFAGLAPLAVTLIVGLFFSPAEAVPGAKPFPTPVMNAAAPGRPLGSVREEKIGMASASPAQETTQSLPVDLELVKQMTVPGVANWTDTGLDVVEGQEFVIKATGGISLQRGNPTAFCGPAGYDLKSAQQPLPDKNIGALVGRVVLLISVTTDPETKKQVRNQRIEVFYIGPEARVMMPLKGRLYLGINENVAGDNSGEFKASIFRVKIS